MMRRYFPQNIFRLRKRHIRRVSCAAQYRKDGSKTLRPLASTIRFSIIGQNLSEKRFTFFFFFDIFNRHFGSIAQLGEHLPYKQGVIGSSPIVSTTICESGSVVERCLAKANVASSNLVSRSNRQQNADGVEVIQQGARHLPHGEFGAVRRTSFRGSGQSLARVSSRQRISPLSLQLTTKRKRR